MLTKLRQRRRRGRPYAGLTTWCDDYQVVPKPGFYALESDGRTVRPDVPLVCVDDAPGDPKDGRTHFVFAGPRDYPQRRATGEEVRSRAAVKLEVHAEGKGSVKA